MVCSSPAESDFDNLDLKVLAVRIVDLKADGGDHSQSNSNSSRPGARE